MDREKVIKLLETAVKNFERYSGDEYGREYDYARVGVDVLEDAIVLLKAQEPVKPIRKVIGYGWRYFCGKCGNSIVAGQNFCEKCGQAVKWE
jgi:hypothetical protein